MALLEIENLSVEFDTMRGTLKAIDRLSFEVSAGETVSLVGESGCGKSITSLAIMGLLPSNGRVSSGTVRYDGKSLFELPEPERRKLRGSDLAMIFQDPMSSLNPSFTVGFQLMETIQIHQKCTKAELQERAVKLLADVGIPEPTHRMRAYPHQLSGGMCQRVMIAMAIACNPKVLIADEPTTALDVTIQAQILDLLRRLQRERGMGLVLITHDLGIVAEMADRVMVMYAGQIVESGVTSEVVSSPRHPYTQGLLESLPASQAETGHRSKLSSIPGMVPDLTRRPHGCQLHPRCRYADDSCRGTDPALVSVGSRQVRCLKPLEEAAP